MNNFCSSPNPAAEHPPPIPDSVAGFTPSAPNDDSLLRVHGVEASSGEKPPFECSQHSLVTLQNLDLNLQSSTGEQEEGVNEPL